MKKILSVLLILSMLLSMIPAVLAEDGAVQVSNTAQLQSAFAAGGSIELADSFDLTALAEIPAGVTAVLDLNGKTITSADGSNYFIRSYGDLTIIDSLGGGGISVTSTSSGTASNYCVYNDENAGLRIEGGTYSITSSQGTAYALLSKGASVTITGGTFSARYSNSTGSYAAHTLGLGGTGSVAIIENGVFDASGVSTKNTRVAPLYILKDSSVQITINGGVFTGTRTVGTHGASAIRFNSANSKLTINGGTFSAVNSGEDNMFDSIKGSVSITGGSFTYDGQIFSSNTAQISGGTFKMTNAAKNDVSAYVQSGYIQQEDGAVVLDVPPCVRTEAAQSGVAVSIDRSALGVDNATPVKAFVAFYHAETEQFLAAKIRQLSGGETQFFAQTDLEAYRAKVFLTDSENHPLCEAVAVSYIPYTGEIPVLTALGPTGSVDTVSADVRAYLAQASVLYDAATPAELESKTSPKSVGQSMYAQFYQSGGKVFTWKWENPNNLLPASAFCVQLSQNPDFSAYTSIPCASIDTTTGAAQTEAIYTLFTDTTYYWRVAANLPDGTVVTSNTLTFTTLAGPRMLKIDDDYGNNDNYIGNMRDLGGWMTSDGTRVPQGRVYRSKRLEQATAKGVNALVNNLGIKTEIDLRNPASTSTNEKPATSLGGTGVAYYNYSGKQYADFINNPTNAKSALLIFTKAENYPIVFHCNGGADRTGSLAFILNALMGVAECDLIKDYELTYNRFVQGYHESSTKFYDFPSFLSAFHALDGATPQEKAKTFCRNAGLSDTEINAIITNIMG